MASEVTELITALRRGGMSLEEVAQQFRERSWPRAQEPDPQTYLELAAAAQRDPRPDVPGSFDDVVAAFDRGELTHTQYRTLADAAAEGMRQEDMREGPRTDE
jgi:hypothetical protein